jgi:hypothetical protein
MSTVRNPQWSSLALNSPYKYGDRITLDGTNRQGLVMGFIGKKKEMIIVQFDDKPGQSVSVKKADVIELFRKS